MTEPKHRPNITIVLPAKDEAAAIGHTLRSLPRATLRALGLTAEVFVLDGNSTDATAKIAKRWGAHVVPDREPGKGLALRHARHQFQGDYVVILDADGTYAPDAVPRVIAPLMRGEADVVLGHRRRQPGSMTTSHFVGNKALALFATTLYGRRCRDLCTGMWAFRGDVLRSLPLRSRRFGLEAEFFALSTRMGLRLAHERVDYLPRRGATKLSFGHDGLRIVRRLVRARISPIEPAPATPPGLTATSSGVPA